MKVKEILGILILIDLVLISIGIKYNYAYNEIKYDNILTYRDAILEEDAFYKYIQDNYAIIKFYANTFQIEENTLISLIKDEPNFSLDKDNIDKNLLDFLLKLEKSNKELFDNTVNPCYDSKEYIIALINYWVKLYPNVDFTTAASIGYIESGYRAKHLLRKNNIFGGKNSKGIISYKNIEYGTLKYIRLLSTSYYGKGLDTVEKIGVKYNPIYDDNGKKLANPDWVRDVNITLKKYRKYESKVDINTLINLKNNGEYIANDYLF